MGETKREHWLELCTQLTCTCSNSTKETLEKDAKYVQSQQ